MLSYNVMKKIKVQINTDKIIIYLIKEDGEWILVFKRLQKKE